jgi:hypothetical protein
MGYALRTPTRTIERTHGHLAGLYRYLGAVNTLFFHCECSAQQGGRLPEHRDAGLCFQIGSNGTLHLNALGQRQFAVRISHQDFVSH